ncbi:MAG: hypothetical protein KF812_01090 [Fimbriimonadaceae bacterium]|nr:hypothetical protein [Fimbriimonadaceae bacterium]
MIGTLILLFVAQPVMRPASPETQGFTVPFDRILSSSGLPVASGGQQLTLHPKLPADFAQLEYLPPNIREAARELTPFPIYELNTLTNIHTTTWIDGRTGLLIERTAKSIGGGPRQFYVDTQVLKAADGQSFLLKQEPIPTDRELTSVLKVRAGDREFEAKTDSEQRYLEVDWDKVRYFGSAMGTRRYRIIWSP